MTRNGIRSAQEITPNMTPLVDVVMVILIFLMLAGSFADSHWFLKAESIAGTGGASRPADPLSRTVSLDLYVDRSADGFVARFGDTRVTGDGEVLKQKLDARLAQFEAIGTTAEDIHVTLHPTRGVTYEQLIKVYEAALRAKFSHVAFARSGGNVE